VPAVPPALSAAARATVAARLRPTLAQLVRDVVADELDGEVHVPAATEVLLRRIAGMAPHLGVGMVGLTLLFDASCRPMGGPFHRLPADARARALDRWRALPGPLASWAVFYEKMGVFAWWSVCEEAEHKTDGEGGP
jgi:hypothetical protein